MMVPEHLEREPDGWVGDGPQTGGDLIGPDSLLWRIAGDTRAALPGGSTGLLQLMYPPLGTAVAEQSGFFDDPFGRIWRSVPQIWATIFEPDGAERARHIRDLHLDIRGVDSAGRRFHALDPETFWWAHATFTWHMFRTAELFFPANALTAADRDRLYAETVAWYARYGVSMRPVPSDYAAFQDAFAAFCAERLEMTAPAARSIQIARTDGIGAVPFVPSSAIRAGRPLLRRLGTLVAIGCLPAPVRERFDIEWTASEQRRFNRMARTVRVSARLVPRRLDRRVLLTQLRLIGAKTRSERYRPAPR
ncbi:oxygenase MpaB family protein [Spirillospora albida]|uniref:oxygenase MpaB family protein n=1 Tax=Spirillospora albida TaxID=58123 RepID=UPI001FDFBB60|nr:oxygenase MpaB family protein [Spirillospora albida]